MASEEGGIGGVVKPNTIDQALTHPQINTASQGHPILLSFIYYCPGEKERRKRQGNKQFNKIEWRLQEAKLIYLILTLLLRKSENYSGKFIFIEKRT